MKGRKDNRKRKKERSREGVIPWGMNFILSFHFLFLLARGVDATGRKRRRTTGVRGKTREGQSKGKRED